MGLGVLNISSFLGSGWSDGNDKFNNEVSNSPFHSDQPEHSESTWSDHMTGHLGLIGSLVGSPITARERPWMARHQPSATWPRWLGSQPVTRSTADHVPCVGNAAFNEPAAVEVGPLTARLRVLVGSHSNQYLGHGCTRWPGSVQLRGAHWCEVPTNTPQSIDVEQAKLNQVGVTWLEITSGLVMNFGYFRDRIGWGGNHDGNTRCLDLYITPCINTTNMQCVGIFRFHSLSILPSLVHIIKPTA